MYRANERRGTQRLPRGFRQRVVVKFRDDVDVPFDDRPVVAAATRGGGPGRGWTADVTLGDRNGRVRRLFDWAGRPFEALLERAQRQREHRLPNANNFFLVTPPSARAIDAVLRTARSLAGVEHAYLQGPPIEPPIVTATDDPRATRQGYLGAAPAGIDARFAWLAPGGDGRGVGFVDLERGWTLNHEDLRGGRIGLISGRSQDYHGHGTAVLGEVAMQDNTRGGVGIAPACTARVVSQWRTATHYSTSEAIVSALLRMRAGDVLLLEAQTRMGTQNDLPVEVDDDVFFAVLLSSLVGIVVVEAAGNGGHDLDSFQHPVHGRILRRGHADFRDSGAIIVGAGSSAAPHRRLSFSNFGSRIDCYGWGQNVSTTGDGWQGTSTTAYTDTFSGTSSASPIVAGAAVVLQGIVKRARGRPLLPWAMRRELSDPAVNTRSHRPPVDRIGVMPNLRRLAQRYVPGLQPGDYPLPRGDTRYAGAGFRDDVDQEDDPDSYARFEDEAGTEDAHSSAAAVGLADVGTDAWVRSTTDSAIDLVEAASRRRHFLEEVDWSREHFLGRGANTRESESLFASMAEAVPERRVPFTIRFHDVDAVVVAVPGSGGRKLYPEARDAFVSMQRAAGAAGVSLRLLSAWRSHAHQQRLRRNNPNPAAVAQRVSAHTYGLAIDLRLSVPGLAIRETSTASMANMVAMYRSPVYKWMALHGAAHGWFPYRREPWHWEYNPPGFKERFEGATRGQSYGSPHRPGHHLPAARGQIRLDESPTAEQTEEWLAREAETRRFAERRRRREEAERSGSVRFLPVRGSENVGEAFKDIVFEISTELGIDVNHLMAVMSFETGGTFSPSQRNAAGSGATGLIQFMPATARALGTTTAALARMSAEEQLEYVRRYFQPYAGRLRNLQDTYMAVLWPAGIGRPATHVMWRRGTRVYEQNSGLDANRDGEITVGEAAGAVERVLRAAQAAAPATPPSGQALELPIDGRGAALHPPSLAAGLEASWPQLYREGRDRNGETYDAYKASLSSRQTANSSEYGGTELPVYERELTAADLREVYPQLDADARANRVPAARIASYVEALNRAFALMGIDTVEAQAAYLGHAAVEASQLRRFTETQSPRQLYVDDGTQVRLDTSWLNAESHRNRNYRMGGSINPLGDASWQQTFLGRGPLQVTHRFNYAQSLAVLDKRAEVLRAAGLGSDADAILRCFNAVKQDPRQAATAAHTFLFSAAYMKMSEGDRHILQAGASPQFTGTGPESRAWMSGGAREKPQNAQAKRDAFARAVAVLRRKLE